MPRKNFSTKKVSRDSSYLEKIETNIESNQSKVSLVLGALIILVIGILVFNYFNRNKASLGPAQQTETQAEKQDISKDNLPGDYTVKDGDTLFIIAEKYYQDGEKFSEIAKANNLNDVNAIVVGQVLKIPKLETQAVVAEASTSPELGTGGGNTTIWGTRIEGNTYTVVEGDWLSKIAGRAYGDIMAFDKIAKANNISNPDHIEPGLVLTIPR
ncbi:LysM peptidoglycan-binding domain-containing protein [Candidatus Daviesbacteria bacterium]|nr:LysM peptidoglycan-binding domain-containing protein [Candidatus Daviesbacteria bacterium]